MTMVSANLSDRILRAGLAFAFLYPPINALSDPSSWIGYFPGFIYGFVPDMVLLHAFGVLEVVLAIWILSGWRIFFPAALMTVMLVSIVTFNAHDLQILFRDLSIASISLSLAVGRWHEGMEKKAAT